MNDTPLITVLCGSASEECEVSRVSGRAVAEALSDSFEVELIDLPANYLPENILPGETVVFPALHGTFGEDGQLQHLLEKHGFAFAGSGSEASALCMNKVNSKAIVASSGFSFAKDLAFQSATPPDVKEMVSLLGERLIIKPIDKGSSVGLHVIEGAAHLERLLGELTPGGWMLEEFLVGREMTIGLLNGQAMGIVEIVPEGGVYDYAHKYTAGASSYRYPADIKPEVAERVRVAAEQAYQLCGCRDFARLDFILTEDERLCFLEINTIPGLTPTSLLPKSASCLDIDFPELIRSMIKPAIERFHQRPVVPNA